MKMITGNSHYSIKRILTAVTVLLAAVLIICAQLSPVSAAIEEKPGDKASESNGGVTGGAYEVTRFEQNTAVGKDHTFDVEETITVNIPDTLNQIEFAIPSGSFRLRGLEAEGVASTTRNDSAGSYLVITDPQALSTGIHTFTIRYKIFEFADRDAEKDILYYNVLLPHWKQPVAEMEAVVSFPEDFPLDLLQHYAGQYGVQDAENRVSYETDREAHTITIAGKLIPENYIISLKAELIDKYWVGALDGIWAVFTMILVMGAVVLVMLILWIIGGRDPRIRRIRQTRPVEGISPVELGYAFNNAFTVRDLVRLIIYFGTRGYLRISEYEPKRYRLYRLKDPDGEEKLLRNAYSILFEDIYKNRAVEMDEIGERLQRIENAIRDDVMAGFSSKEMQAYTPLSKTFRMAGIILLGTGIAVANGLKYSYQYIGINYIESAVYGLIVAGLTWALCAAVDKRDSSSGEIGRTMELIIGAILAGVLIYNSLGIVNATGHILAGVIVLILACAAVFLAIIMRARGKGNAVLMMKFRQLRRFIYHPTPKDILENYLADPQYYYDMMIYALTFGAEESWAISFLTLDVPEPEWYTDDIEGQAFSNLKEKPTTVDYARDIRSFVRTVEGAYEEMQRRSHRR